MLNTKDGKSRNDSQIQGLIEEYQKYKTSIARNVIFDGNSKTKGKSKTNSCLLLLSERNVLYQQIQLIKIYLATETFDEIEKDVKVTTEAALGLIGGTMGLFTGFSILSGVEIIYYLAKFFISLSISKADYQKGAKTI